MDKILKGSELAEYVFGAYKINITKDGDLAFDRFNKYQLDYAAAIGSDCIHNATLANCSVTVEFDTDADRLALDFVQKVMPFEHDTMDVLCDGVVVAVMCLQGGDGEKRLETALPEGKKHVAIYLPSDDVVELKSLSLFDCSTVGKRTKKGKLLLIGDSITQGYGPYMTSMTYADILGRITDYDLLNHGIGGYYYDEKFVVPLDGYTPDRIVIALGTNQAESADKAERIEKYFAAHSRVYGNVKTFVVTPLWRCDRAGDILDKLNETADIIRRECKKYGIPVIDGFEMIPRLGRYFKDGLHPNAAGMQLYALNLSAALYKLGF